MSDVHALVGAYAVDAVDDVERAAFERHLAECQDCRRELASLQEAAAMLAAVEPVEPPERLRGQVLAGIGAVRPLPPAAAEPRHDPLPRRRFRPATLVAAAAAVLALGAGAVVWQQVTDDTSQAPPTVTEADRILDARDAEEYTQSHDGVEVTVVRSRSLGKAVLVTEDLPAPPDGKVYELWLSHEDEGMVPAGLIEGGAQRVVLDGDAGAAIGAGITVEPEGGSDEPTSAPMMSFTFEKA